MAGPGQHRVVRLHGQGFNLGAQGTPDLLDLLQRFRGRVPERRQHHAPSLKEGAIARPHAAALRPRNGVPQHHPALKRRG